jgi:hypothetical protein
MFIDEISRALNMKFNIDQSVDEFVCDYIIQSIKNQFSLFHCLTWGQSVGSTPF